jgi:hypothetical protein
MFHVDVVVVVMRLYCTGHTLAPPLYRPQVGLATLDGMISDRFMWCQTGVQGSSFGLRAVRTVACASR